MRLISSSLFGGSVKVILQNCGACVEVLLPYVVVVSMRRQRRNGNLFSARRIPEPRLQKSLQAACWHTRRTRVCAALPSAVTYLRLKLQGFFGKRQWSLNPENPANENFAVLDAPGHASSLLGDIIVHNLE